MGRSALPGLGRSGAACVLTQPVARRSGRVALWVTLVAAACGGPDREIRAALSEADRQRFDAGAVVAVDCLPCHDLRGADNRVGPALRGVFGRKAASRPGFGYSDALRGLDVVWDRRSLAAYLSSPQGFAPGTSMVYAGVRGPERLSALLFYLEQVTERAREP